MKDIYHDGFTVADPNAEGWDRAVVVDDENECLRLRRRDDDDEILIPYYMVRDVVMAMMALTGWHHASIDSIHRRRNAQDARPEGVGDSLVEKQRST